jgi:hypothetical protein
MLRRPLRRPLLALVLVLAACSPAQQEPGAGPFEVVIEPTERLDLLFMIDNSPSPSGQREFIDTVPLLLRELAAVPGGTPDLHLGVVTSDLGAAGYTGEGSCARPGGDRGALQARAGCGLPAGQRYLAAPRGGAAPSEEVLRCIMGVGVAGCGYEHQLASVARALDPVATPENVGFVRSDAHLAIVLLTDEDDCSAPPDTDLFAMSLPEQDASARCALAGHVCQGAHPPAAAFRAPIESCDAAEDGPLYPVKELVARVRAAKTDPDRQLTVAAVYGMPAAHPTAEYVLRWVSSPPTLSYDGGCQSQLGNTALAFRLPRFVEAFGKGGSSHDLCVDDLGPTAARIGQELAHRLTSACLPQAAADCQVTAGAPLPRCAEGVTGPCWRLDAEPRCPGSATKLAVQGAGALAAGTRVVARCTPAPKG